MNDEENNQLPPRPEPEALAESEPGQAKIEPAPDFVMSALESESASEPHAKPKKIARKKKEKKPAIPWRQRVSVTSLILWTVLFSIVAGGGASGYYGYRILYQNKLTDTWAIMFLELERQGNQLADRLESFAISSGVSSDSDAPLRDLATSKAPDLILKVNGDYLERIRGDAADKIPLSELNLKNPQFKDRWNILKLAGEDLLAVKTNEVAASQVAGESLTPGVYYFLWRVDIASWFLAGAHSLDGVTAYLITKEGKLLYSSANDLTETNFIRRPLVQKFIGAPIRQGQFDFQSDDGPAYGFFYEVPRSNVMMFLETPRKVALASVNEVAFRYGIVLLTILIIAGLILQFPLNAMLGPMRELVRLAWEIGEGNFDVQPQMQGFGELNLLSRTFYEMGQNLNTRDREIKLLLVEQQEKFRLADELAIAQSIQDNFLSKEVLPRSSSLEVATRYAPAAECAGDWYSYFFNEKTGESVFVIADVSGHGAGSAMFTAIIAAVFEEMRMSNPARFSLEEFSRRLNQLILKLGRGKWHATLLAARFQKAEHRLEILNAGHPAPLLVYPTEKGIRPEPVDLRSDLIGLNPDFEPKTRTLDFPPGLSLLMFTDGLLEARPDRKLYSPRRLGKACQIQAHQSLSLLVENVYEDWKAHLEGLPALDDLCLMAVRAI